MAVSRTSKATVRPKRSKAEVQKEFADISREVESEVDSADTKASELARAKEAEVRQEVEGVTVEAVVERISGLGLEVTRALAGLSEKLTQEVSRLAAVREAVELERKDIERLHKIDVAATALDQLVQQYAQENEQLEAGITSRRTAWEEELRAAERERKELEESLKKQHSAIVSRSF